MRARHHFPMTFSDLCITHPQQRCQAVHRYCCCRSNTKVIHQKFQYKYSSAAASAGNGRRILRPLPNHRALENGKKNRHERTNERLQPKKQPPMHPIKKLAVVWLVLSTSLRQNRGMWKGWRPSLFPAIVHSDVQKGTPCRTVKDSQPCRCAYVLEGYAATTVACRVPTLC